MKTTELLALVIPEIEHVSIVFLFNKEDMESVNWLSDGLDLLSATAVHSEKEYLASI